MSNVEWCEAKTDRYRHSIYISELTNSISNICFLYVSAYQKKKNLYHRYCDISLFCVGIGSFYFHATETHIGEILDELPMSVLAYNYFNCMCKNNHYDNIYKIILLVFWINYIALKTYNLFLYFFTLQIIVVLYTITFKIKKNKYQKQNLVKGIIALVIAKICWQYERYLHNTEQCESNLYSPLYYLHSYWHIGSAMSHYYIMHSLPENREYISFCK
jgi:hypothetical protein